eukprot:TRINITY_DN15588_c0_g3_i2.p1 TRINITY_DN15588_c0_g3~~TRINITY_DN15588_c0_g3_i2.p1  ORF type:complete len:213 (-),score=8.94 TRINITY_DN15588_c0_g3_i2:91-729(-)
MTRSSDWQVPLKHHPKDWDVSSLASLMRVSRKKDKQDNASEGLPLVEYFPGEASLVLSAPHDGTRCPKAIPRRISGVMVRDVGTKGLAARFAQEVVQRGLPRPHLLILHLSRTRMDANRPREEAATDHLALAVWDCYHSLLAEARRCAASVSPNALALDFHSHGHSKLTGIKALELLCSDRKFAADGARTTSGLFRIVSRTFRRLPDISLCI